MTIESEPFNEESTVSISAASAKDLIDSIGLAFREAVKNATNGGDGEEPDGSYMVSWSFALLCPSYLE